jgi:predicted hydrolase (HD superfamily)
MVKEEYLMSVVRSEVWQLLTHHVTNEVLLKHCLAVEIAMRAYARYYGEDEEYWGTVGLLHDVDFEKFPHDHPNHVRELLPATDYDDAFVVDIESHARDYAPERTRLQKTLLAVDELTGFVIACALVRPDKSLDHLEVKSVMKKFKDKAFARAVNRETIKTSAEDLGVDLKEHIAFVIQALAAATADSVYQEIPLIS